jgi:ABC-type multidrug transport system ATPase subunit
MERVVIRFEGVSFSYREGQPVLSEIDLAMGPGLTLVVGPNGCGKSTLLKLAAGVEHPDRGTVSIEGRDLWKEEAEGRRHLAYLPEQPDLTPYATVEEVVRLVCRLRGEPIARAAAALETVGLQRHAEHSVRELSMGQRRRAVLAAAMIGTPRTLLLDEPLDAMDRGIREGILIWIHQLLAGGATLVIVTHEIEPFATVATRALTLRDGRPFAHEPLPDDPGQRMGLLDFLARGGQTWSRADG